VATIIEVMVVLAIAAIATGLLLGCIHALTERNERAEKLLDRWLSQSKRAPGKRTARKRRIRPETIGAGMVTAVGCRNRQTSVQKMLSIRRADARTGGKVTVGGTIVHYLVSQAVDLPATQATHRAIDRRGERLKALASDFRKLNRERGDDMSGLLRDAFKLSREHDADPVTPIALWLLGRIALHVCCVLVLPRRQSLPDLLSGIATAKDPDATQLLLDTV
jgi:hypothetical protein